MRVAEPSEDKKLGKNFGSPERENHGAQRGYKGKPTKGTTRSVNKLCGK